MAKSLTMMEMLKQTHRTILFEQFTHHADTEAKTLYDILSYYKDNSDAADEVMYDDIKKKLEVHSFKEFLDKFQPKVYEYVTGTAEGVPFFQYTADPMEAKNKNATPREIIGHTYYEMLVNMYGQKSDSGVANIEFKDNKLREILTPKREIEALYDTRRKIPMLMEKYDEAIKKNENAAPIAKRLKQIRREAFEQLKNPTALMSIGLDDANRKIAAADTKIKMLGAASGAGGEAPKLLSGRGGFDKDGRWILIPAKASTPDSAENTDSASDPAGDASKKFAKIIQGDLDKHAADQNNFTKALIVSAYTGTELADPLENLNDTTALAEYREQLIDRKQSIQLCFKQAKEAFIKALSESVQKLLCVKIFFDHATIKGGNDGTLPKNAGLIVANCSAAKLIDDKIKDKFKAAMEHLGLGVADENKLWFAILPHVLEEEISADDAGGSIELDDDLFGEPEVEEDEVKPSDSGIDFAAAKSILKIMDECKIMTVFNFAPDDKTTFSALNAKRIEGLQTKLNSLNLEHAVYALPNFTIMRKGSVPLNEDKSITIKVPAMYIDAAYVAAGLLITAQNEDYWNRHGFKPSRNNTEATFIPGNACVRIDFEWDNLTPLVLTKFNRERSIAWSSDVVKALTKNHFGFAFDGDRLYDHRTGNFIDNTYILNARTLKRNNGEYQPIFRTLVKDFIRAYLKTSSASGLQLKEDRLKSFEETAKGWANQNKIYKAKPINLLLHDGENIIREGSNLKVELSGGEDLVEVEIID